MYKFWTRKNVIIIIVVDSKDTDNILGLGLFSLIKHPKAKSGEKLACCNITLALHQQNHIFDYKV